MDQTNEPFFLHKGNIYAIPITHYNMEMAAQVFLAFRHIKPDCVAVELAETMQLQLLHAASRLPDISVVTAYSNNKKPLYYLAEPCEACFEGLRCALESGIAAYCIDLDVEDYPQMRDPVPDPYSIQRIGHKNYYDIYKKIVLNHPLATSAQDTQRELHMAHRLKELSLKYDKIFFVAGMAHVEKILELVDLPQFPKTTPVKRTHIEISTLTEESCRNVMGEAGWFSSHYEEERALLHTSKTDPFFHTFPVDRQKLLFQLYKNAGETYKTTTGFEFPGYCLRNLMKFCRNYSLVTGRLMPDLFQLLTVAKGCVDPNYAYETWLLATSYPHRRNIDGLPELNLTPEEVWGGSKWIQFHLRQKSRKENTFTKRRKDQPNIRIFPPGPFTICSYPPEDLVIESFGDFLKKRGTQILTEDASKVIPFSTSLEDGIDTKETIRHLHEKKLYIKVHGRPSGGVGSVVMIFDEDAANEGESYSEKFGWKTTWLGENTQESDMALYATFPSANVVGPGISRCQYGGFMLSSPPRRMFDVWSDADYQECRSKSEVLLMAAIDYSIKPVIVYVAAKPPRSAMKTFAGKFGKKIVFLPIGQLSPVTLNKLRIFHVLDGYEKRSIAGDYIF